MESFEKELTHLINRHSIEHVADMPDFLLAGMICRMIEAMGPTIKKTLDWHGCDSVCHPSPAGIPEPELSVGSIEASGKRYRVTNPHAHKTLVVGDIVSVVSPTPGSFYLLRHHDMSFHRLDDDHDQYVHVREVKP